MVNARDLRNNKKPLLARLQRQVDNYNNKLPPLITVEKDLLFSKKISAFSTDFNEVDSDFDIIKKKNTRLNLYGKRSGR